jgi:hypothetical protein
VTGSGTTGRLSKWVGVPGSSVLGDSVIFEDKFGKVGIGTTTPTSPLTVQGMIETTLRASSSPTGRFRAPVFTGLVVSSLNGLKGDVTLAPGKHGITPLGNTLTIAASGSDKRRA